MQLNTNATILKVTLRKSVIILVLAGMTFGAFATLGDGKSNHTKPAKKSLLSTKSSLKPGAFTLRSGYNFRGSQVINTENSSYINLNTTVTYQNGHTSYIVPLKKKVILNNKIVFNPNASSRR
ncbi:MAG TPA: hypothetical protein VIZ28_02900 [Chitinophagaceae bacterium]